MVGLRSIVLKLSIGLVALISLTGLTYLVIGCWNRWRGGWVSVFYCYAGSRRFIDSYALPGISGCFRWRPVPIGVIRQEGSWGLVLASSATEDDFLNPANADDFAKMQRRLSRVARHMGVQTINLAGILPGILHGSPHLAVNDTRASVTTAVCAAVAQMRARHLPFTADQVIVLGGAGRIGSAVVQQLRDQGLICHVVDPAQGAAEFPTHLHGQAVLMLDIARKGVIAQYIPLMWPGLLVLNEVFPAPSRPLVAQMKARGVQVFHLAGVAGRIIPPLPHGYEHAIPCCAARPTRGAPGVRITPL